MILKFWSDTNLQGFCHALDSRGVQFTAIVEDSVVEIEDAVHSAYKDYVDGFVGTYGGEAVAK